MGAPEELRLRPDADCSCTVGPSDVACGCGAGQGSAAGRERPRWFAGQLVGPTDLTELQDWVLARQRRHNRMLHGWGVDCGLAVTPAVGNGRPVPWTVEVGAGYALAPSGDEILVDRAVRIDVRLAETGPDPSGPADPWCAPLRQPRDPDTTYYLAVRYDERPTRPVRATACDCAEEACEYSRIREGYRFAVLDELPAGYGDRHTSDDGLGGDPQESVGCTPGIWQAGTRSCPPCPHSPWVVLANLIVARDGSVTVDALAHRRFLASYGATGSAAAGTTDRTGRSRPDDKDQSPCRHQL